MAHESIAILGVRVSNVDVPQSLAIIEGLIESGAPHQMMTVNTEFVMAAQKDAEFKTIIHAAFPHTCERYAQPIMQRGRCKLCCLHRPDDSHLTSIPLRNNQGLTLR
ncbi:MAG: hypothetical protein ACETWR_17740 [Anaerolineae bacterium]